MIEKWVCRACGGIPFKVEINFVAKGVLRNSLFDKRCIVGNAYSVENHYPEWKKPKQRGNTKSARTVRRKTARPTTATSKPKTASR